MTTTIRWSDNSLVEQGHRIYKSDTYFTKDDLPPMLVELGPNVEEYVDEDGEDGENWYIVGAYNEVLGMEMFSEPFIVGLSTVFSHDVFDDGSVVATYRFDGNADDLGGTYDGSWDGSEQYGESIFPSSQSASFDESSFIDIGYVGNRDMTVSCWIDPDGGEGALFSFKWMMFHRPSGGELKIWNNDTGTGSHRTVNNVWSDYMNDGFFHLVVCIGEYIDDADVYINGEKQNLSFSNDSFSSSYPGGTIGNNSNGNAHFSGKVDQFRIFNRPLTEQEVQILYQEGAAFL